MSAEPLPRTNTELDNISTVLKSAVYAVTVKQWLEATKTSLRGAFVLMGM